MKNQDESKRNLITFLNKFPTDATCWSQATDEVRDLARIVREYYNEMVLNTSDPSKGIEPVDFRSIKTPAEWNTKAKIFIMHYWVYLPEKEKIFINKLIKS